MAETMSYEAVCEELGKSSLTFNNGIKYRPIQRDGWVEFLLSPKANSGMKIHIPIEYDGTNYLNFVKAVGEAMENVPSSISKDGVLAFKVLTFENDLEQTGVNTCIYLGERFADHPENFNRLCNELYDSMQRNGVKFMKVPDDPSLNINKKAVKVAGSDGALRWTFDGYAQPEYAGIWKKYADGNYMFGNDRKIPQEMKEYFKDVKIKSRYEKFFSNPKNKNFVNMLSELDSQGKMEMNPLINSKTKELKGYVVSIDLQKHSVADQQRIIQELKQSGIDGNSIFNKNGKLMIEGRAFTRATDNFFSTAISPMPPIYGTPQPNGIRTGFDVLSELYKDNKIGRMSGGDEKFFIDMRQFSLDDQAKVMKKLEYYHIKSHFHGKNSSIVIIDDEQRFERILMNGIKNNVSAEKSMFKKFGPHNVPQSVIDQLHDFKQNKKISKVKLCDAKGVCVGEGYHINMTGYRPEEIEKMRKFLTYKCGGNVRLSQSNPGFLTVQNGESLDQLYHHLSLKEGVIQSRQAQSAMSLNSVSNASKKASNFENSAVKSAEESPAASKAAQEAPVEWTAGEEELQRRAALSASKNSAGEAAESTAKVIEKVKNVNNLLQKGSNAGKVSDLGAARQLGRVAKAVQNAEEAAKAAKGAGLVQKGLRLFR